MLQESAIMYPEKNSENMEMEILKAMPVGEAAPILEDHDQIRPDVDPRDLVLQGAYKFIGGCRHIPCKDFQEECRKFLENAPARDNS